jgi:hypothetical protein
MSFENDFAFKLDRETENTPFINECHKKAAKVLEEAAIDPNSFKYPRGDYDEENIQNDLDLVSEYKKNFESKKLAEILEVILYEHFELSDWFGSNAETIKTSEFDDIINGIDLVVELSPDEQPAHQLAFGVDVTFSENYLEKKFNKIQKEIDLDKLAEIKYFDSSTVHGRLRQIPRLVVGLEKEHALELAGLWYRNENKELGSHVAQFTILQQVKEQLAAYFSYAKRNDKEQAKKAYAQALASVNDIIASKQNNWPKTLPDDQVFERIREQLTRFK